MWVHYVILEQKSLKCAFPWVTSHVWRLASIFVIFSFFFSFFDKNNKCLPRLAAFKICMNRKLSNIKFGLQQSACLDYKDQQSVDHKLWIINYVNPFALAGFMQRCLVVSILTLHRADHRSITARF